MAEKKMGGKSGKIGSHTKGSTRSSAPSDQDRIAGGGMNRVMRFGQAYSEEMQAKKNRTKK